MCGQSEYLAQPIRPIIHSSLYCCLKNSNESGICLTPLPYVKVLTCTYASANATKKNKITMPYLPNSGSPFAPAHVTISKAATLIGNKLSTVEIGLTKATNRTIIGFLVFSSCSIDNILVFSGTLGKTKQLIARPSYTTMLVRCPIVFTLSLTNTLFSLLGQLEREPNYQRCCHNC